MNTNVRNFNSGANSIIIQSGSTLIYNSTASNKKKDNGCMQWANNGSCFRGDECLARHPAIWRDGKLHLFNVRSKMYNDAKTLEPPAQTYRPTGGKRPHCIQHLIYGVCATQGCWCRHEQKMLNLTPDPTYTPPAPEPAP